MRVAYPREPQRLRFRWPGRPGYPHLQEPQLHLQALDLELVEAAAIQALGGSADRDDDAPICGEVAVRLAVAFNDAESEIGAGAGNGGAASGAVGGMHLVLALGQGDAGQGKAGLVLVEIVDILCKTRTRDQEGGQQRKGQDLRCPKNFPHICALICVCSPGKGILWVQIRTLRSVAPSNGTTTRTGRDACPARRKAPGDISASIGWKSWS